MTSGGTEAPDGLEALERLVRDRRSSLRIAERPVGRALIERLCELAMWAPNHKNTQPWRFAAFDGEARAALGRAAASDIDDAAQAEKARTKYMRAPVMVVVASAAHDDPVLDAENRDAVAAGIENLLLGATAAGLASYWSTGAAVTNPAVFELCGFAATDRVVGIVYLGWPSGTLSAPAKASAQVVWVEP